MKLQIVRLTAMILVAGVGAQFAVNMSETEGQPARPAAPINTQAEAPVSPVALARSGQPVRVVYAAPPASR